MCALSHTNETLKIHYKNIYHSSSEMWLICRPFGCLIYVVQEFHKINYHNQEKCWPTIFEDRVNIFMDIYVFISRDNQHDVHFNFISFASSVEQNIKQ